MANKILKISEENHKKITIKAASEGRSIIDVTNEIVSGYFATDGGAVDIMDVEVAIDPLELTKVSREKAEGGFLVYSEWLSGLTPREQDALKHVIKAHKSLAESVGFKIRKTF